MTWKLTQKVWYLSASGIGIPTVHLFIKFRVFFTKTIFVDRCKRARDSPEMRRFVGLSDAVDSGDRIFGALVLGRYDAEKRSIFKSSREDIKAKLQWRT